MLGRKPVSHMHDAEASKRRADEHRDTGDEADLVSLLHPGFDTSSSSRDSYTFAALAATPPSSALYTRRNNESSQGITPLLLNTASAARGRRRDGGVSSNNNSSKSSDNSLNIVNPNPRPRNRPYRAASELVLNVGAMEEVHGVDVSWLHHTNKGIDMAHWRSEAQDNAVLI